MIALYCKKNHHFGKNCINLKKVVLCDECRKLSDYAKTRSDNCPFMANKTFCSNCHVHCYNPQMREKIRKVMRFSGPRMIFYHPIAAIHHVVSTILEKKKLEKESKLKEMSNV